MPSSRSAAPAPAGGRIFRHTHRVRYRECDPMGVAYHTHYLDWFEAARTEALRSLGIAYRDVEARGVIMPVVDAYVRYLRPVLYDDEVTILTRFEGGVPSTRVEIAYEVLTPGGPGPAATGRVTLCFVDRARNRPIRAPREVAEAFSSTA